MVSLDNYAMKKKKGLAVGGDCQALCEGDCLL